MRFDSIFLHVLLTGLCSHCAGEAGQVRERRAQALTGRWPAGNTAVLQGEVRLQAYGYRSSDLFTVPHCTVSTEGHSGM